MGFSLKNFLEEATAQANPFDRGKTAQTVRQQRAVTPPPQAKTGINYSSPVTAATGLIKRALPNTSSSSATTSQDKRSNLAKAFDQVNPYDNNKTFKNATQTGSRSVVSQYVGSQKQGIKSAPGFVKAVADPFISLGKVGVEYNRAALAKGSENDNAYNAARTRLDQNLDRSFILGGANRLIKNAVGSISGTNQDELDQKLAESIAQNEITASNAFKKTRTPQQMANNYNNSNQGNLSQIDYGARMRERSASNVAGVAASAEVGLDVGTLGLGSIGKGVLKPTATRLLGSATQGGLGNVVGTFGQDPDFDITNGGQVAKTFAVGAGTGLIAGEGMRGANNVLSKGVTNLLPKRTIDPNAPTLKDLDNVRQYRQDRGGFVDDAVYADRLSSLRKFGLDPANPDYLAIDTLLSAQGGYIKSPLANDAPKPKGKVDPLLQAEKRTNEGLAQLSEIRKQYSSDQEFFDKVILENQDAKGEIGDFARQIARRDATEGSIYNKNYLTEILDDELAPINSRMDQAVAKSAQRDGLVKTIRDLEKSTGQKGLYQKVAQQMQGMNEQQQIDFMGKALKNMRDSGVLAADFINKQAPTPPKPSVKLKQIDAPQGKTLKEVRTNTTGIKNYNPDGLPTPANKIVHDLASFYESLGSKQGVSLVSDGEAIGYGKKRISNNSGAYSELYAELGRTPTSKDWYDYAYRQINDGKAPKEITDQFEKTLEYELTTDKTAQDPSALIPKGAKIIKNQKPDKLPATEWDSLVRSRVPDQKQVSVVKNPQGTLDIQKSSIAPVSRNVTIDKTIPTEVTPTVRTKPDKDFVSASNKYLGSLQAADTTARQLADQLPTQLKGQDAIDAIVARDNGVQTGRQNIDQVNQEVDRIYNNLYAQYKDAGFDMGYVDNYSPRIYKNPQGGEAITKDEYLFLTRTPGQTISRTAQNVKSEDLLYKTPQELLAHYTRTFERAKAGREYFEGLKQTGHIVESGTRPDGMIVIDASGMPQPSPRVIDGVQYQGNYYAYPDVAKKLNKIFGIDQGNKFLSGTAKVASTMQDIGLSGGIPGTPVNAFTFAQMTKELTAGKIRTPFKALWNARSAKGAQQYFKQNAPIMAEMQKNGISLNTEYSSKTLGDFNSQLKEMGSAGEKASAVWDKTMSDPTFKRFMPSLQIETYKQIKSKYAKKLGEEQASALAGSVVKNFYGLTDLTSQATRSKAGNDAVTTVLFAPKYRESMVNFWINNAKAIDPRKWSDPQYSQNIRFNVGATMLFGAMQAANMALNGTPTWDNPDGKKDKLIVPASKVPFGLTGGKDVGIPFLSSIATVPRAIATGVAGAATGNTKEVGKSVKSFLGYGIRPLADLADNENYFGSRIYDPKASAGEKLGSQASYLFKAYQHPYVREGLNVASSKLPENIKKFTGAKEQTPFETASKATESPLRFYDPTYYKGGSDKFQANAQQATEKKTVREIKLNKEKLDTEYKNLLSKEDYEILNMTNDEKKRIVNEGIKSSQDMAGLEQYALDKKKELGIPVGELPDNFDKLDKDVQSFIKNKNYTYNKDDWETQPLSDEHGDIYRRINQIKPEGFPDLPKTNKVADLYARFKQDQEKGKWSKLQDNEKRKEFLRSAYKSGLTDDQKFIDDLGTEKLLSAVENGDINIDAIKSMVDMDNQNILLGGTAMLSKTVRRKLGLGSAPSTGGSSSGSGSSKKVSDSIFNIMDLSSTRSSNRNALRKILNSAKL